MCKASILILGLDPPLQNLLKKAANGNPFGLAFLNQHCSAAAIRQLQVLRLARQMPNDLTYGRPRWILTFCGQAAGRLLNELDENPLLYSAIVAEYDKKRCSLKKNPDKDIRQAQRDAERGYNIEVYLHKLGRIGAEHKYREAQRLLGDEEYIDYLIAQGELPKELRLEALRYYVGQKFSFLFEPTLLDLVRQDFPNHAEVCHGAEYPGHCCLQNLIEKFNTKTKEEEVMCRYCEDILGTSDASGENIWTGGGGSMYSVRCAIPPDPDEFI